MSHLWSFSTYSPSRLRSFFEGSSAEISRRLTDAVMWDEDSWDDHESLQRLVERVSREGLQCAGRTSQESECLDQMIQMVFSPEGLAEEFEVESESPDGLHPSVVRELLSRKNDSGNLTLLPVLLSGRRFGVTELSECDYCFLSVSECEQLSSGISALMAGRNSWSQPWIPEVVEECLLGPLRSAVEKERPLFGALG